MDQSDGKAKVWRKKDLLMIPNIQAHLKQVYIIVHITQVM